MLGLTRSVAPLSTIPVGVTSPGARRGLRSQRIHRLQTHLIVGTHRSRIRESTARVASATERAHAQILFTPTTLIGVHGAIAGMARMEP